MATKKTESSGVGRPKRGQISQAEKKRREAEIAAMPPRVCPRCGIEYPYGSMLKSSETSIYPDRLPLCKSCIGEVYEKYVERYVFMKKGNPERDAIRRMCMVLDIYYNDEIYDDAVKNYDPKKDSLPIFLYLKKVNAVRYLKKSFDDTIEDGRTIKSIAKAAQESDALDICDIPDSTIKFFGKGFTPEDYLFLQEQYDDWTSRHECQTKSQEEIFKDICYNRLQNLKARQNGTDTKNITDAFNKLLESGKLQPKQNASETMADNQSFGTLIEKWETTRPIPDVDEDLRDVDKIGEYVDIFFKGHMAEMLHLDNDSAKEYREYMKKYSAKRPDYDADDGADAVYDKIFGKQDKDNS